MTITYNSSTSNYTIDMSALDKSNYPTNAEIKINGEVLSTGATSLILPLTWSPSNGVYSVIVKLTNALSGSVTEKKCFLADKSLLCKVIESVNTESCDCNCDKPNTKDSQLMLWYLLNEGISDDNCFCVCDNLKTIYNDLNNQLTESCC